jgi:hypothetical protein
VSCLINLQKLASINSPGGEAVIDGIIKVILKPEIGIGRLSFIPINPLFIAKNMGLMFVIEVVTTDIVKPDILLGDVGCPEINVQNIDGVVYRLKRGNFKDFFDFNSASNKQEIIIPYGSFEYNLDLKKNVESTSVFWKREVSKIYFDFLCHKSAKIQLNISNVRFESLDVCNMDVFDLVNIEAINKNKNLPLFYTESNLITLMLTKKSIFNRVFKSSMQLEFGVTLCDGQESIGSLSIDKPKIIFNIPLQKYGPYKLRLTLSDDDNIVASSSVTVVKCTSVNENNKISLLGVSDSFSSQSILLGGGYRRIVLSLSNIKKINDTYRISGDNNPFKTIDFSDKYKVIVAIKGMPKWLSSHKGANFGCYAPDDFNEYKKLVKWLITFLSQNNVFALESWNEANVSHEWKDTIGALKAMQKIIWSAKHELNASLIILSPSSTSWDFDFFNKLREENVYDYCDAMALHGYTYQHENHSYLFDELERFVKTLNRKEFDVYITEIGFRTPAYSDIDQAMYLVLFTLHGYFRKFIKAVIWFRYTNPVTESLVSYDQNASSGYAMVGYGNTYVRPSLPAYIFVQNYFEGVTLKNEYSAFGDTVFQGVSLEQSVFISYSPNKQHKLLNELNVVDDIMLDMYGNLLEKNCGQQNKLLFSIIA